ncbi:hypothetical protein RclHR1_00740003 [Rhizophagus clarus]|uniref:Uncharacterized protein n=1 Tax=Rhizophagus clarus TaxID=94130 RepID=A0A2Z6SC22_9GLOM|nr:hypothetical protein RclHR1_00740003 [Rhizophagus clarus]
MWCLKSEEYGTEWTSGLQNELLDSCRKEWISRLLWDVDETTANNLDVPKIQKICQLSLSALPLSPLGTIVKFEKMCGCAFREKFYMIFIYPGLSKRVHLERKYIVRAFGESALGES